MDEMQDMGDMGEDQYSYGQEDPSPNNMHGMGDMEEQEYDDEEGESPGGEGEEEYDESLAKQC